MSAPRRTLGERLARFIARPQHVHSTSSPADLARLQACLRPGDVLLVEGHSRVSTAIKYLTQSTWSHAALYVRWRSLPACMSACAARPSMWRSRR
jgi:hypothetical protein